MAAIATDLVEEILDLKKRRNAVILAHNYQVGEIQDLADFVGDSLGLAYKAAETNADVIVFCGVHFMGETAKIVNPSKKVVIPDLDAGCSLSDSCPPEKLASFLNAHPEKNYYVIAYINCSAGVKALSDVICTSGNADRIVRAAPADRNILFVPDQNLGAWVMERTGRKMDLWQGNCYVHVEFTARSIGKIREQYPNAPVVAHPECTYAVRMLAGYTQGEAADHRQGGMEETAEEDWKAIGHSGRARVEKTIVMVIRQAMVQSPKANAVASRALMIRQKSQEVIQKDFRGPGYLKNFVRGAGTLACQLSVLLRRSRLHPS